MLSDSNARLAAARRLTSRRGRREAGRFLAEGAQAVREAMSRPDLLIELYATAEAADRHAELLSGSPIEVAEISEKAAAALSETVSPQGLVAVCHTLHVPLATALARRPGLVAVLVEANEPGNAGTILRTADAAGAGAVILAGDSVDIYNGKAVRASAGSLFHLDVVLAPEADQGRAADPAADLTADLTAAGLLTLATTGAGTSDLDTLLDDGTLARPSAWFFGNEARGLPEDVIAGCERAVRIPIHGRAESLNLAAAAAVCLYASARAQRARPVPANPLPTAH